MDMYDLQPDPCDNRLIRLSNCLVMMSCICNILAAFVQELRDCAQILECVAQTVFYCTLGWMAAQVDTEITYQRACASAAAPYGGEFQQPIIQEPTIYYVKPVEDIKPQI